MKEEALEVQWLWEVLGGTSRTIWGTSARRKWLSIVVPWSPVLGACQSFRSGPWGITWCAVSHFPRQCNCGGKIVRLEGRHHYASSLRPWPGRLSTPSKNTGVSKKSQMMRTTRRRNMARRNMKKKLSQRRSFRMGKGKKGRRLWRPTWLLHYGSGWRDPIPKRECL